MSTALFRAEHVSADDTGDDFQSVNASGYASEAFEAAQRIQSHGFSSNPPAGSHGIGLRLRGESDLAVMLGMVDPTSRGQYGKNLNPGDSVLYNADGSVWKMVGKSPNFVCPGTCTLTAQSFVFKCGSVTYTLDGNGLQQQGGFQKHNDHDVGATHLHTGVIQGGGLTGEPQ